MTTTPIGDRVAALSRLSNIRAEAEAAKFNTTMDGFDAIAQYLTPRELTSMAQGAWSELVESPYEIPEPLILDAFLRAVVHLSPQDAVDAFSEEFPEELCTQHKGHIITWLPDDAVIVITYPQRVDGTYIPAAVIRGGTYAQMLAPRVA